MVHSLKVGVKMNGNNHQQCHQLTSATAIQRSTNPSSPRNQYTQPVENVGETQSLIRYTHAHELLNQLNSGQLLMVDKHQRCGVILYKRFHTEFAGPGAAVGGLFDIDCQRVVPVGNFSVVHPESHEERQKAFWIRRHWIRLTEQLTENSVPIQRAQMLLRQFEYYFDRPTLNSIPDEALAGLVGVLPQTVRMMRRCGSVASPQLAVIGG
jgi:hypothetical protein